MRDFVCCICERTIEGKYGNNPAPFVGDDCCDDCNGAFVVPIRMQMLAMKREAEKESRVVKDAMAVAAELGITLAR
jgi:hypothetical protein